MEELPFVQAGSVQSPNFSSEVLNVIVFPVPQHPTEEPWTSVPIKELGNGLS